MKSVFSICTFALILAQIGFVELSASAQATRPNVIVILTDDQGAVDAGCYGSADIKTPAIDGLAHKGVRFTQFYAAAPLCSPSRAGLMTGRYPLSAGVPGNIPAILGSRGMPGEQFTLAEMMKGAGYATAHIGKWHLGSHVDSRPNSQGFDYSFGHWVGCIDNYSHFFYWDGPNRHDLWRNQEEVYLPGKYFPDLMVEEAGSFIRENKNKPFFMYFAMNAPHYPYQGEPKWISEYANLPHPRNEYAAFVSTMDEKIGQLLAILEEQKIRDDTIVIFQSDHGHSVEGRAHGGGGNAGKFRGAKFSLFEGGIRVPAIVSWPKGLPMNETRDQMGHSCDWLPTIAELCQVKLPEVDLDGKSLLKVIRSAEAATPHETLHWAGDKREIWAVRQGDWKLLAKPHDPTSTEPTGEIDGFFLVNLAEDIGERTNMVSEQPEKVLQLKTLHDAWIKKLE